MAYIKIKNVKTNLDKVLNYAKNGKKTEHGILVSAISCVKENAYQEMKKVKQFYHKEDGILAYHIIQSFNGKEVSPEKANQIGQELCKSVFGENYQIIICTHIDKDNVHNHIVVNSVALTGEKYHNSNYQIALLKDESDKLCEKYDLSVITTEKANKAKSYRDKRINYYNRNNNTMQIIKNEIDNAIDESTNYKDFKIKLKAKGYEIYDSGKYFTIKSPYYARNIRLERALGEEYSCNSIKEHIYRKQWNKNNPDFYQEPYTRTIYYGPNIDKEKLKTSPLYRHYVHWLYLTGQIKFVEVQYTNKSEYYKQQRQNKEIFEELNFIVSKNFNSFDEIREYGKQRENELPELKGNRELLWKKYNKSTDENIKLELKKQIEAISSKVNEINHEVKIVNRYLDRHKNYEDFCERLNESLENEAKLKLERKKKKERSL